ncbi:MAG: hypothetical protein AAGA56_01775 [Myxococcota bacterium]
MDKIPAFICLSLATAALTGCPREDNQQQVYPNGNFQGQGQFPPPGQPGYQPPPGQAPPPQGGFPPPQPGVPAPGAPPPPAPGAPPPQPGAAPAPASPIPGFPFPIPGMTPAPQPGGQPAPQPGGAAGGTAQPIPPGPGVQAAAAPLTFVANQQLSGFQPAGDPVAGNFGPGQSLEQTVQFQPNRCYGAVAAGAGITGWKIQFVLQQPIPGMANPTLAEQAGGAQTVLGAGGKCFTLPVPIGANVRVIYTATAGQGVGAGRLYVR